MIHDIQFLFRDVADLTPEQRTAYFDQHQVPPETRAEVESLLEFDARPGNPLTSCIAGAAREVLSEEEVPREGAHCGPYRLVRLLGRGGMGEVCLAVRSDGEVEQHVAIKMVRNLAGNPAARDRFLRERQFLASLNHPGVARLLDAGHTADGQPYLVMEHVEGVPLDVRAAELDLHGKLALFLKVAAALAYAHRNLVIHRDLKPSNILVDSAGQPKLLDFGIARMLDESADTPTQGLTRERLLTPEYASPEQVRGAAHTTSTDVYSLGAVLYQLLTGSSPHTLAAASSHTLEEAICRLDAPPPSKVNPALPRDLDFIVAKALRKEPEDRYAAVDAMADDVRAFLDSRPVQARAGNSWYRARKLLRRHWLPVAAAAGAALFLAVGLYAANRERAIAQHRFLQLRRLANQVLEFDPDIRELPGSTNVRQKIVSVSLAYMDGLSRDARDDSGLALELAGGYLQLAKVQGVPAYSNLGQFAEAETSLRKADNFAVIALRANPRRPDALVLAAEIAQCRMMVADVQRRDSDVLAWAAQGNERMEAVLRSGRASPDQIRGSVSFLINVGQAYMNQHRFPEAIRLARRGVELARSSGAPSQNAAQGMSLVANALRQSGDLDGALAAIAESRRLAETAHFAGEVQRGAVLYTILWRQGQILGAVDSVSLGRTGEAVEPLRKAFDLMEQLASKDAHDVTSRNRVGTAAEQLAGVLTRGDPAQALAVFDRGILRQREISGAVRARLLEARLLALSSYPLRLLHRQREGGDRIAAAFALLRTTGDYPAAQIRLGSETADVLLALAEQESETGHSARAVAAGRELLEKTLAAHPTPRTDLMQASNLARIYATLERVYSRAGDASAAGATAASRIALWRAWQTTLPHNPYIERQLRVD